MTEGVEGMTDAHQPPVTPITFIESNLELAEKELAKAQKDKEPGGAY